MSLVGSLEDLGLGEILQIVSLSGKSGVLWIRSPQGDGRIVFDRGAIRGAVLDGGPSDLGGLLRASGVLPEADVESLQRDAQGEGCSLEEMLIARTALDPGRLEELRERHVEATVLRMFGFLLGEFSFEIRDEPAAAGGDDLLLRAGMNAQFLALEGTRLRDERAERGGDGELEAEVEARDDDDALVVPDAPAELEITVLELLDELGAEPALEAEPAAEAVVDEDPTWTGQERAQALAQEAAARAPAPVALASPQPAPAPAFAPAPVCNAAVLVDRDLPVLEWAKKAITPLGLRTHIFPRSEQAIERIRQYFARGEHPLVVLSTETPADSVSGARDWAEIAARLRAQVANQPIVLIATAGAAVVPANERAIPDATATRPPASVLADERAREKREALAAELRAAVERATRRPPAARPAPPSEAAEPLRALREWSARMRDSAPSEVLRLVLEFAGRHFDRAATFWVREGEAQAIAQVGLAATGGPDDAALRGLCVAAEGPSAFRKVFESRAPVRSIASEPADRDLAERLGARGVVEMYVAPIESGDQVAALLYADNAATGRPLGDTSALEVIVHEASLALDRAVLERALEEAEGSPRRRPEDLVPDVEDP